MATSLRLTNQPNFHRVRYPSLAILRHARIGALVADVHFGDGHTAVRKLLSPAFTGAHPSRHTVQAIPEDFGFWIARRSASNDQFAVARKFDEVESNARRQAHVASRSSVSYWRTVVEDELRLGLSVGLPWEKNLLFTFTLFISSAKSSPDKHMCAYYNCCGASTCCKGCGQLGGAREKVVRTKHTG